MIFISAQTVDQESDGSPARQSYNCIMHSPIQGLSPDIEAIDYRSCLLLPSVTGLLVTTTECWAGELSAISWDNSKFQFLLLTISIFLPSIWLWCLYPNVFFMGSAAPRAIQLFFLAASKSHRLFACLYFCMSY